MGGKIALIYGKSDDLIEIDGCMNKEYCNPKFVDGVTIDFDILPPIHGHYDKGWKFEVTSPIKPPQDISIIGNEHVAGTCGYSDVAIVYSGYMEGFSEPAVYTRG